MAPRPADEIMSNVSILELFMKLQVHRIKEIILSAIN